MRLTKKYYHYNVKEEKNRYTITVFKNGKIEQKIIIPREKFKEEYKGYTLPSRIYAFDIDTGDIIKSPDKVGYTGHDTFFKIKEEDEEVIKARLLTQSEWDFLCGKKILKQDASPSNYKLCIDIEKLCGEPK
jgi:outer membrane protein assembly factor BamB